MSTQEQHPVEYLFNEQKKVTRDRKGKVTPVQEMIAQNAFFPGGSGLWTTPTNEEQQILPRHLQACRSFFDNPVPIMPVGKVMVLGNDFGQKWWHEKCLRKDDYDLDSNTWKNLLLFLKDADIRPKDCFFTNAYMGLRLEDKSNGPPKSTGRSPGAYDEKFVECCESFFLDKQLSIQKPRLILALGKHSIKFIAGLSSDLAEWKPWTGFKKLDKSCPLRNDVRFEGSREQSTTVVALVHPSMRPANVGCRRYCEKEGKDAELTMLKNALRESEL